jgi:hypothetical protein
MPNMKHSAAPNSEGCDQVTPASQEAGATVPSAIRKMMANAHQNNSELTKSSARAIK